MTIQSDIQKLDPGIIVELYVLDCTAISGGVLRFHAGVSGTYTKIVWQGNIYEPFPIEITGFESSGKGQPPKPKAKVANVNQLFGTLNLQLDDLVGAKFTRKRTFAKYLDAPIGSNPDPTAEFPNDIYYVERKVNENKIFVEYELAGVYDFEGIKLPRRQVVSNLCLWEYMGPGGECPWEIPNPPRYYKADDSVTLIPGEDVCGKHLTSCRIRFSPPPENNPIPFGGFPAAGRYG